MNHITVVYLDRDAIAIPGAIVMNSADGSPSCACGPIATGACARMVVDKSMFAGRGFAVNRRLA